MPRNAQRNTGKHNAFGQGLGATEESCYSRPRGMWRKATLLPGALGDCRWSRLVRPKIGGFAAPCR